jgi:hypothetical protein
MDIHCSPIEERIAWVFDLAGRHGEKFRSPESWLARERHLAKYPTAVAVLKCMDGRINVPVATRTAPGILMPFRNLGGMFDLGWPHLGEVVAHHVSRMVGEGRQVLFLITYHFSKGDPRRGCAGFNYDTAAAHPHARQFRVQFEHIFGADHGTVYPLVCGFETDEDALILHGAGDASLNLADLTHPDRAALAPRLAAFLPDMPGRVRADLLPLLLGNLDHIAEVVPRPRATSASSTSSTANG